MSLDARKSVFDVWEQQRRRPACASEQSDQRLCYSLIGKYIYRLATSEILILELVSVAEETGLSLTLSETRRQVLLDEAHIVRLVWFIVISSGSVGRELDLGLKGC